MLKSQGIQTVFALDKVEEKLELIKDFGAHPININHEDPLEVIRDVTGKVAVDGTFEAVGLAETVQSCFDLTAAGGTLVIIGNLAKEFTLPLQLVTGRETTIRGSYGFTKQDLTTGSFQSYTFEENIYGSEISFAPKLNAIDEDDGYLVSITTDLNTNTSEGVLFDAKNINSGPVCTMPLPHMVCAGTHATWAQIDEL